MVSFHPIAPSGSYQAADLPRVPRLRYTQIRSSGCIPSAERDYPT